MEESPDRQRQTDDAYRAVGRYVVEFSQLVGRMRHLLSQRMARGDVPLTVPELALGEAPAQHLSNAFFGICRWLGQFDEEEKGIEAGLRRQVSEVIEARNDIAHGDWWVGFPEPEGDGIQASLLIRIRPLREDFEKAEDITPADLDARSEAMIALIDTIEEFGRLCLGLPVVCTGGTGGLLSQGDYRLRDIYSKPGGRRGAVTRAGPKAAELAVGAYYPAILLP